MNVRKLISPALVGLALLLPGRSAVAQQAGTVELGGFLQLDRLDEALRTKRLGGGAGGRAGIFVSPRWELEADASYTQADPEPSRTTKAQINYYVGRLNYNIPWGGMAGNAVILGMGVGGDRVDAHSDLILSPDIGLRAQLGSALALRFDVLGMLAPNPQSQTFKSPAAPTGRNDDAAYLTNFLARAGVSLMLGMQRPVVAAPRVIDTAAVVDTRAADRARALQDSIDRANRMRQDSIDAANRRMQMERDAAAHALADARSMLNAPVYFDYDKSEIRADAKSALDAKLPLLRANSSMRIRIEGNTDARGSNEYNMALGLRRANAARRYLVSQGIDNVRFDVVSYGEERPVDQGTNDDAYAKNRRDDFVITVGGDNISVPK
ncbi:MAG: OmpA family protein [Polaromonas sp.]|nr:OmpA family protein [Gemmatimonadaceae bacterium]